MSDSWWRSGVLYQIYVRSFADSNGDGIGDLPGVVQHLDHLAGLGIEGIWLSPVTVSPNADWGYDVADYCAVDPDYGNLEDVDELIRQAGQRGIRVILDLVPNHTSDRHPWFVDSVSAGSSQHRDFYVWADPRPDGTPPNNWLSSFGGSAWTLDKASGQYYLHNFLPEQPDLNWWNEDVRRSFDEILRFWFDRGVAGFRIDVCHGMVKDALLRDNPPARKDDPFMTRIFGQRSVYNANRPEAHDVLQRWRRLATTYQPERLLLGETHVFDLQALARFYGNGGDELHMGFNFPFVFAPFEADVLRAVVEETEALLPPNAWPVWTGSNHDVSRFPSRWADGDPAKARCAALMLLTLRGTPVLYQGDEIGMVDTQISKEQLRDPVGLRFWPAHPGRDPERTPMPWRNTEGAGFTQPGVNPWLPLGDLRINVADQRGRPDSMLRLVQDLIQLRRNSEDLLSGEYTTMASPPGVWAWRRGRFTVVALNLTDASLEIKSEPGHIALGTDRSRDGQRVTDKVELEPWEGVIWVSQP